MKSLKNLLASAGLIGLGVLIHCSVVEGGGQQSSFGGSVSVGRTRTSFSMPGGYTARGKLGAPRRYADTRELRFVPEFYGNVIAVTPHGDHAVLWYSDPEGGVRNVLAPTPDARQFLFERQATRLRQVDH